MIGHAKIRKLLIDFVGHIATPGLIIGAIMYVPLLNRIRNEIVEMGMEPERLYKAVKRFKDTRRSRRVHPPGADIPVPEALRRRGDQPASPYHLLANSMVWLSDRYPRPLLPLGAELVQRTHPRAGGLTMADTKVYDTLIVGAGFTGIGTAIKLTQAGVDDFVILERERPRRRHVAGQHVSRCGVRHPVAAVLVLVREEPELVAGLLAGRRDLRAHRGHGRRSSTCAGGSSSASRSTGCDFDEDEGVWTVKTTRPQAIPRPHRRAGLRSAARPQAARTSAASTPIGATRSTAPAGTTTTTSPASGSRSSAPAPAPCRSSPNWSSRPTSSRSSSARPAGCCPGWTSPTPAAAQALFAKVPATQELARQALYWGHEVTATALVWDTPLTVAGRPAGQGAHPRRRSRIRGCAASSPRTSPRAASGC